MMFSPAHRGFSVTLLPDKLGNCGKPRMQRTDSDALDHSVFACPVPNNVHCVPTRARHMDYLCIELDVRYQPPYEMYLPLHCVNRSTCGPTNLPIG